MNEYDFIAKKYAETNYDRPLFKYAVYPSLFEQMGDITGKSSLDLACGEGIVARELKRRCAGEVRGVDSSKEMIKLAEEIEKRDPKGIKYIQGVVGKMGKIGAFDVITAAFLLHYAYNERVLEEICKDCYDNLVDGGTFLTINNNPEYPLSKEEKYQNIISCINEPPQNGDKLHVFHPVANISFLNYYWSKEIYEEKLRKVGFKNIQWIPISISKAGIGEMGSEYWKEFLEAPFFIILKCER